MNFNQSTTKMSKLHTHLQFSIAAASGSKQTRSRYGGYVRYNNSTKSVFRVGNSFF